ncbi:MAG TPA: YrbL family protein [Luteolibacter sp.]|nr:YrbL family protein [Luteolibacter sp.]
MTGSDTELLRLDGIEPVARGRMRLVFRHPHDPSLLVKVIRPDVIDQRWGSGMPWYKKRRRYGQYISFIRETEEYIAGYAQHGASVPFAQKITGYVETDLGLGMVMEAALDREGNVAPTLARLAKGKLVDDTIRAELECFAAALIESDIIVADLNPANIVRAYDPERGHHFVLIDGLGVSTILPFKRFSRALNRASKRKRVAALWERIGRFMSKP